MKYIAYGSFSHYITQNLHQGRCADLSGRDAQNG